MPAVQPTSICPDMSWVSVAAGPPVLTVLGLAPAAAAMASSIRFEDEPGREKATDLPLVSFMLRIAESALAYHHRSAAPVEVAEMMAMGAPLAQAPMAPRMPVCMHTSMLPVITGCSQSEPPW